MAIVDNWTFGFLLPEGWYYVNVSWGASGPMDNQYVIDGRSISSQVTYGGGFSSWIATPPPNLLTGYNSYGAVYGVNTYLSDGSLCTALCFKSDGTAGTIGLGPPSTGNYWLTAGTSPPMTCDLLLVQLPGVLLPQVAPS